MQGYVDMYDESARTRSTVTLLVPGSDSLGGSHVLKMRPRLMLARADGWLNLYHRRCESYLVLRASSRVNVCGFDHSAEPLHHRGCSHSGQTREARCSERRWLQ